MKIDKALLIVLLLSLFFSFVIYGNVIRGEFISDDIFDIQQRQELRNPNQLLNLFVSPYNDAQPEIGLYRPFTMASYMFNFSFGESPNSFHIINIILHALTTLMVFVIIRYLLFSNRLAFFTSALFLFHPIHTEALTPIVGRSELLSTLFSLITIYLFFNKKALLSLVTFLLAIFSKETALMAIPIIFFIQWQREKEIPKLRKYLSFLLPVGVYLLLRFIALEQYIFQPMSTSKIENPLAFVSISERIFTTFKTLYMYVEKLIFPVQLSNDYSFNVIKIVSNPLTSYETIFGIFILMALFFFMFSPKTRYSPFGLAATIFFFPYFLISNFLITIGTIFGERLIYFPSIGFCLIFALILNWICSLSKTWKKTMYVLLVIILFLYGAKTITRNESLLNNDLFFKISKQQHPDAFLTRLYWASRFESQNKWKEAKGEIDAAYKIYPNNSSLHNNMGLYEEHFGNFQAAEQYYKRAIFLDPKSVEGYFQLGAFYFGQQKYDSAERYLSKAISIYQVPQFFTYYTQTAINLNNPQLGIDTINKYFGYEIKNPEIVYSLGIAYFANKDYPNAIKNLNKAKTLGITDQSIDTMIINAITLSGINSQ